MRKIKSNHYSKRLSDDQDPKDMWKTLNEIIPKKPKSTGTSENLTANNFNKFFTSIASELCRHFVGSSMPKVLTPRTDQDFILKEVNTDFVRQELQKFKSSKATGIDQIPARLLKDAAPEIAKPIAYLVNLTISSGVIPLEWKEAKVTPIFKSGKKDDVNNYRPISVLPLVSKIMERAVQKQLVSFLTENNVLSINQSGFQKSHSTETALIYFTDYILERNR